MTFSLASLKNSGRAAAMAVAIGTMALVAMPAMAASGPSFSFGIQIPGSNVYVGPGPHRFYPRPVCLSDDDIINELEDAGWRRVDIGDDIGRGRVIAYAAWGRGWYQMVVNRCTGSVNQVQRISRGFPDGGGMYFHDHNGSSGGLGLQFNFGN